MKIGILNGTKDCYVPYEVVVKRLNIFVPNKNKEDIITKTTVGVFKDFPKIDTIIRCYQ